MGPDDLTRKVWGFSQNPFSVSSAETEEQITDIDLNSRFIKPPYYDQIISNPDHPVSSIVFGYRGDGKSVICNRMKEELMNKSLRILVVDYTKFSDNDEPLDEAIIETMSLESHIIKILDLCLNKYIKELEMDSSLFDRLNSVERSNLEWFIHAYHYEYSMVKILDNWQKDKDSIIQDSQKQGLTRSEYTAQTFEIVKNPIKRFLKRSLRKMSLINLVSNPNKNLEDLSSLDLLKELRDLIVAAGFISIYVIVDKIDEGGLKNFSSIQISKFIEPLITSLEYLELKDLSTKLFLPIQIKYILGTKIRSDRIKTIDLDWSSERLCEMLKNRILAFSGNKISSFREFVNANDWDYFKNNILYYSANNPRNLTRLIGEIISELCSSDPSPNQINRIAIINGIKRFKDNRCGEADSEIYLMRLNRNLEEFMGKELYSPSQYQ
jgi:hypothetical protein